MNLDCSLAGFRLCNNYARAREADRTIKQVKQFIRQLEICTVNLSKALTKTNISARWISIKRPESLNWALKLSGLHVSEEHSNYVIYI
jgi:ribosomal protein L31E